MSDAGLVAEVQRFFCKPGQEAAGVSGYSLCFGHLRVHERLNGTQHQWHVLSAGKEIPVLGHFSQSLGLKGLDFPTFAISSLENPMLFPVACHCAARRNFVLLMIQLPKPVVLTPRLSNCSALAMSDKELLVLAPKTGAHIDMQIAGLELHLELRRGEWALNGAISGSSGFIA